MKIHHIHIDNVQGARAVDIDTPERVTMICGPNGAGKSSIADAVRLALTGESHRVSLKKDLPLLVSDGAKSGRAIVATDGGVREAALPKLGKEKAEINPLLPLVLAPHRIAAMDSADLRTALFGLMNVQTDREAIAGRMVSRGCDPARVAEVQPMLRSGFDTGAKHAKTRASEARGSWKAITGETYGSSKAEGWRPDVPRFAEADLEAATARVDSINARINAISEDIGRSTAESLAASEAAQRRQIDIDLAARIPRIEAKLATDRAELERLQPIVDQLRAAALSQNALACPCCGVMLAHRDGKLIEADRQASNVDDYLVRLPAYEQALDTTRSAIANGERDLKTAMDAKERIDANTVLPAAPDVSALRADLQAAMNERSALADTVAKFIAARTKADKAQDNETLAASYHADVQSWETIASALEPDGIPGELLAEAIGPLNKRLAASSQAANWSTVQVREDMTITYGGRPYALLSESERWRVDAVIGEAVALLSGLRLLLLDRFDVLDLAGRADLIDWLEACGDDLDTVLLLGTLKSAPALPDGMRAHWIEGGVIAQEVAA